MYLSDGFMNEESKIKEQLAILEDQHRELDNRIRQNVDTLNMLEVQRLKKQKLSLKDQITSLHSTLFDDIIA